MAGRRSFRFPSVSEGSAADAWVRSLLDEALYGQVRHLADENTSSRRLLLTTDAKSLYDHLMSSRGASSQGRRLGLERNMIRAELELENQPLIWVPTIHQGAAVLTKGISMTDPRMQYFQASHVRSHVISTELCTDCWCEAERDMMHASAFQRKLTFKPAS